jgi:hypothetical protein
MQSPYLISERILSLLKKPAIFGWPEPAFIFSILLLCSTTLIASVFAFIKSSCLLILS